jgi:dihydrolipoamide dehydrogenase
MSKHFDIAVLGSGPGGYIAALKAGQLGARVAIVEKEYLGGTCLNYGCIPSKALLASAELRHHVRHAAELGIDVAGTVSVNWPKIQARKDKVVQTLRNGVKGLLGARKVAIFPGKATLNGTGKVVVSKADVPSEEITADKVIIAVGSVPSRIPRSSAPATRLCTGRRCLENC